MLRIHKPNHKLLLISITSILSIGVFLGLYGFTYTPELSHAEMVDSSEHRTMADIVYMQDITPVICNNSELEKQYQLKDSRDQKTYWVAKLRDGNCWMTQNLALELWDNATNTGVKLTSLDSDVSSDWVSTTGESTIFSSNADRYYSAGMFVYTKPDEINDCSSSNGIAGCIRNGWIDVSNLQASSNSNFDSIVTDTEYDAHYLSGNYYGWYAATADSGRSIAYESIALSSICPRYWKLPLGGVNCSTSNSGPCSNNEISGSYYNLLKWYGLTELVSNPETGYNIWSAPLYITRYGYTGQLQGQPPHLVYQIRVGNSGSFWTSAKSTYGLYRMNIVGGSNTVQPSSSTVNYLGYSVRCVALGKESGDNNVEISVNPTISLEVTDEVEVEKGENNPSTVELEVKVASNQGYTVSMSADKTELSSETSNVIIPAKEGLLNTNENGWGVKLSGETSYKAITSTPTTFYTASGAEIKTIPFIVGISTSPDLPNGEYSTDITVTATQN